VAWERREAGRVDAGPGDEVGPGAPRRARPVLRTSVPSARAVAGGLLVAVATLLVFVAARDDGGPTGRPVVVAARDLAPGTRLGAEDLEVAHLGLPEAWPAARRAEELVGAVTVGPLRAGELVQPGAVVDARRAPGRYELALRLPADRVVADRLGAGDRVEVLATTGQGPSARTDVVVRAALVQARSAASGGLGTDGVGVTLALEHPADVLAVAHALRSAEVTLVRATAAGDAGDADGPGTWPPPEAAGASGTAA